MISRGFSRRVFRNKNVDIKFSAHDAFSGITFIRYAQNRKIGKTNNLNFLGAIKPKGLNRIAKIGYGHIYLRGVNISFY